MTLIDLHSFQPLDGHHEFHAIGQFRII